MRMYKLAHLLLLVLLLGAGQAWRGVAAASLGDLFGRSSGEYNATSIQDYGPVRVKTAEALRYLVATPQQANRSAVGVGDISVPFGAAGRVLVRRSSLNILYVAFQGQELEASVASWASNMTAVPFLADVRISISTHISASVTT